MASTFKTLLNDDVVSTRTLLHEAIPITGTICTGTYKDSAVPPQPTNVKTYTHGMFESTYDYPYLSSSANHIFDITYGHSPATYTALSGASVGYQIQKKRDIYNQFAQILLGYDEDGTIKTFDSDGISTNDVGTMHKCIFISFARILVKDEIKKGSFLLDLMPSGTIANVQTDYDNAILTNAGQIILGDYGAANQYHTSPAGDYGLIFSSSLAADYTVATNSCGLIFYQAGVLVLNVGGDTPATVADEPSSDSVFYGAEEFGFSGSENLAGFRNLRKIT